MGTKGTKNTNDGDNKTILQSDELSVKLPSSDYIRHSEFLRDGTDLVLHTDNGDVVVQNYFITEPAPYLIGPDGTSLSPPMVLSFLQPAAGSEHADTFGTSMYDTPPIGVVSEIDGEAYITRTNGITEELQLGSPVHQGDIVETNADGALNITFIDETSFAISEDARLSIDEYVFDPATAEGTTNFSVLKGMFVYTSGMIGREDPDDVLIDTPQGSIGIRGTIIAGDVDQGEITVVEGAIVLRDFAGNEMTLATQFETAKFDPAGGTIENMGQISASDMTGKFAPVAGVSGSLFSSINDVAAENSPEDTTGASENGQPQDAGQSTEEQQNETQKEGAAQDAAQEDTTTAEAGITDKAAMEQVKEATRSATLDQNATLDNSAKALTPQAAQHDGGKAAAQLSAAAGPSALPGSGLNTAPSIQTDNTGQNTQNDRTGTNTNASTNDPVAPLPFQTNINILSVDENTSGAVLAHITGINTSFTTVSLLGPSAQYYEIFRIGDNRVGVRLKSGIAADFEDDLPKIEYSATNATGTKTLNGSAIIALNDVNEMPENTNQLSDIGLSGGAGNTWSYNFSQEFHDQDNADHLTYTIDNLSALKSDLLTAGVISNAIDIHIDSTTGFMTLKLNASALDQDFDFTVIATDAHGLTSAHTYTYNVFEWDFGFTAAGELNVNNANMIASNRAIDYTISGNENNAIFGMLDDMVTITGNENQVNTGDSSDTITITDNSINNIITGGNGDDSFEILNIQNKLHGDSGNDLFSLDLDNGTSILGNLTTMNTGILIDGGADTLNINTRSGGDILKFGSDGTTGTSTLIDFTQINDDFIQNIEILNFTNNDSNGIKLSYSDVIAMTDHNNTLIIEGDSNDTLDFLNDGHAFEKTDTITDGADTLNVFSNGEVTLIVDTNIDVTAGLPAV